MIDKRYYITINKNSNKNYTNVCIQKTLMYILKFKLKLDNPYLLYHKSFES